MTTVAEGPRNLGQGVDSRGGGVGEEVRSAGDRANGAGHPVGLVAGNRARGDFLSVDDGGFFVRLLGHASLRFRVRAILPQTR